ncbi:helix-turn-helix domain-containing protein [Clostridium sp.]|uniref:helix-turn-helix domain-containing protein n=1 Tax=Clostridium sp. TaxID=1506 RepID=UPI00399630DE
MKNIVNKDKELKVAIPNKLFKEIDIYSCNSKDGVSLQVAKVIHLYYKLYLLTPMNSNKLRLVNLNIICEMFNVNATSSTLKAVKDRLIFLQEQGYIKVNMNIEDIKSKNDLFDIEFLVPDDLLSDGFTFLNANEVEYFLDTKDTNKALVFLFIKRCLNDRRGYAFPTIEYIGFCTTLSKNSIMKALKELKKEGIITIDNPNFYTVDKNTGEIRKSNNTYTIKQENLVNKDEENEEVIEDNLESDIKEDSINIKEEIIEIKEEKFDINRYTENKKDGLYTFDDINNKKTIVTEYKEIQFPERPINPNRVDVSKLDYSNPNEIPF